MESNDSEDVWPEVLRWVRQATKRRIDVPSGADWSARKSSDESVRLTLRIHTTVFGRNLQRDLPASPFFALCIAWWYERQTHHKCDVSVCLEGPAPTAASDLLHWHRAEFLLSEVANLLGDRFVVTPSPVASWPDKPRLNAPTFERVKTHEHHPLSEHAIEVQIANGLFKSFPVALKNVERQLPVGLFGGAISRRNQWTPGSASQIDLWGMSMDEKVVHLIELKTRGNATVGMLPEALYYARLVNRVRLGKIHGAGTAIAKIQGAERIVMWLVAPKYHPLICVFDETPLAWLNDAMRSDAVELRILPIELDKEGIRGWRLAEALPPLPAPLPRAN